jgi:hypothetical protein
MKDVGSGLTIKPSAPFAVTGAAQTLANYTLTQPTLTGAITPVHLQVDDAAAVSRAYTGGTAATVTGATLGGVLAGDGAGVTLDSAGATGVFRSADVGSNIPVTAGGFAIAGALAALGDYVLDQPGGLIADITPKALTAQIINDPTKTYDGSLQAVLTSNNFQISGWVNSEGGDVQVVRAATSQYGSKDASLSVGVSATLEVPDFSASTTKLSNYALPTTATGVGTINKADLVAQIMNNPTKTYDGTVSADPVNSGAKLLSSNYSLLGFATGEGADVTVSQATGAYNSGRRRLGRQRRLDGGGLHRRRGQPRHHLRLQQLRPTHLHHGSWDHHAQDPGRRHHRRSDQDLRRQPAGGSDWRSTPGSSGTRRSHSDGLNRFRSRATRL